MVWRNQQCTDYWLKSPPFNGFEPAQMKPNLNLSQLDEEFDELNDLDKCFYEPHSIIVTPGKK